MGRLLIVVPFAFRKPTVYNPVLTRESNLGLLLLKKQLCAVNADQNIGKGATK
jgi:hypothetical protein